MIKSLREGSDFPIFLNADHTHSLPSAMEAAKAGFDWILDRALTTQPNEIVPYKLLPNVVDAVKELARARLELFSGRRS